MKLSIVIPALNEADNLARLLPTLLPARDKGHEVILCDGGSKDATLRVAIHHVDVLLSAPRGRASQMNAAARHATGDLLLFLHADTRPPDDFASMVCDQIVRSQRQWGHFDVRLESRRTLLRVVQGMMNVRSRLTGIATGDQAIFVRRDVFDRLGGYPGIALMEDIALSAALKRIGPPVALRAKVSTSARRWERNGVWRTVLKMWRLRLAYWLGADTSKLAEDYHGRAS